jgi:hypothetical protein
MLEAALTALQDLPPVVALRFSRWSYASVNAAHIVGIALLFGAIVPMDLRLMGCWRSVPIRALTRILIPVAIAGLVLTIAAGALLFATRAVEYVDKPVFLVKMTLVACGIANALLLRRAAQWEAQQAAVSVAPPWRLQAAGAFSILL